MIYLIAICISMWYMVSIFIDVQRIEISILSRKPLPSLIQQHHDTYKVVIAN
jgi:hypothetical protein